MEASTENPLKVTTDIKECDPVVTKECQNEILNLEKQIDTCSSAMDKTLYIAKLIALTETMKEGVDSEPCHPWYTWPGFL